MDGIANNNTGERGKLEQVKDNSLKAAGYAYLIGDAALATAGFLKGDYKEASGGWLWALGGLACARYGNPDADKQLQLLGKRLGNYLRKQNVAIPQQPNMAVLSQSGGVLDTIETFLYEHPSQILNTAFAIGGSQLIRSGLQQSNKGTTASGALVMAGALAGLLIPEQKPDPANPPQGAMAKAWSWVQEKPLRLSGSLFALNNLTMIWSGVDDQLKGKKGYLFKYLTAASYILGNTMLMLSSKSHHGHGEASREAMEQMGDVAARVIAAQRPELQEELVQQISAFLSTQPEVHAKADEIATMLHTRLAQAAQRTANGWMARVQTPTLPAQPTL